jgi:hypothetical protein
MFDVLQQEPLLLFYDIDPHTIHHNGDSDLIWNDAWQTLTTV